MITNRSSSSITVMSAKLPCIMAAQVRMRTSGGRSMSFGIHASNGVLADRSDRLLEDVHTMCAVHVG